MIFLQLKNCFLTVLVFASNVAAGPAEMYLSDEFFPGMHILEKVGEDQIRIYRRSQKPSASESPLIVNPSAWSNMQEARSHLSKRLKIAARERYQLPWELFDSEGTKVKTLETLKSLDLVFLLEVGQWMWPAVRVGFEQNVSLVHKDGRPAVLRTLSLRPVVFQVEDFLSLEETQQVMEYGKKQGLVASEGSMNSADRDSGTAHAEFRTSEQTWIDNRDFPLVAQLDARVARLTRVPASHNEPVQLLRYKEGAYYQAHMDWIELEHYYDQKDYWLQHDYGWADRMATVFWYLNDIAEGGETNFPKAGQPICHPDKKGAKGVGNGCVGAWDPDYASCSFGLRVKPKAGSVILWYNMLGTGRGDRNALHAGCPVGKGLVKWSANKWVNTKPPGRPEAKWIPDHPAVKRYGFIDTSASVDTSASEPPDKCMISLINDSSEDAEILWIDFDGGLVPMGKIPKGRSTGQNSFIGHQFKLRLPSGVVSEASPGCVAPRSNYRFDGSAWTVVEKAEL